MGEYVPRFVADRLDQIDSMKLAIKRIDVDIGIHEVLSGLSRYPEWSTLKSRSDDSLKVLTRCIIARNTVVEEPGSGGARARRVNDEDRREIAADMRAITNLLDVSPGSAERINRLRVKKKSYEDEITKLSQPFVGTDVEVNDAGARDGQGPQE